MILQFFRLCLLGLLYCVVGCSEILYYGQATHGQLSLLSARDDIETLIEDDATDPALKFRLQQLLKARTFAKDQLKLPVGDAYLDYVELDRPYVIWNITAAEEFSLSGYQWCYPIVGCQSYRGYFDKEEAFEFARALNKEGLETYVSGVDAYSTLGWFDDPVLSTFLKRSDASLAALLFHELAHRVVYIKGDTAFNESFATAVEQAGIKLWLEHLGKEAHFQTFLDKKTSYRAFIQLVLETNQELKSLYQQNLDDDTKRQKKQDAITRLRERFASSSAENQSLRRFQHWINSDINNAKLITIANYHNHVEAFSQLLSKSNFDFAAFYQQVEVLGKLPKKERDRRLLELSEN